MIRRFICSVITAAFALLMLSLLFVTLQPSLIVRASALKVPVGQDEGQEYVVQAGDSLYRIAQNFYGNGNLWTVIAEATNAKAEEDSSFAVIQDPKLLRIGQKVWIPNQPTLSATTARPNATVTPAISAERRVSIVSPTNNSTVSATFTIVMAASGLTVEPAGEIHPNSGHMHLLIDEDFVDAGEVIINDDTHLHFGQGQLTATLTLSPGMHVLRLQFGDGAHMALADPKLRQTITVTVNPADDAMAMMPMTAALAEVHFVTPANGATVPPTFTVEMMAHGITVEPAGEIHDRAGHMHILIDEDFVEAGEVIISDDTHLHYGKGQLNTTLALDPGVHVLRLQLGNGAHMALEDPALRDTITVTVAEKGAIATTGVYFVSPSNGVIVSPTFAVVMAANGIKVEPAGEIHDNAGHMHILVDDNFVEAGEVIISDDTHLHFGKGQLTTTVTLPAGDHVLRLQLGNGAHMALDDPSLQDTITVTVAGDE